MMSQPKSRISLVGWGFLAGMGAGALVGAIIGAAYVWWEGLCLGYGLGGLFGLLGLLGRQRVSPRLRGWAAILYGICLWSGALLLLDGWGHREPHLTRAVMLGLIAGALWGGIWERMIRVKERGGHLSRKSGSHEAHREPGDGEDASV